MAQLAYDIARCYGIGNTDEGCQQKCKTCLRRTAEKVIDPNAWVAHMTPPKDYINYPYYIN